MDISVDNFDRTVGVSIVLPNYNGVELLKDNIPSVVCALKHWGVGEIIIVDDCSSDRSVEYIQEQFPTIKVIVNQSNKGFSETCNIGMAAAQHPVYICMNTDVKVSEDFISFLVHRLTSKADIFAVTPQIIVERE